MSTQIFCGFLAFVQCNFESVGFSSSRYTLVCEIPLQRLSSTLVSSRTLCEAGLLLERVAPCAL